MKLSILAVCVVALALLASARDVCWAGERAPMDAAAYHLAQRAPWHGWYYHSAWGMPVALVVPPNAELQSHYGWGVGGFRVTTIYHQFGRNWPGPALYDRSMFRPTPPWPSDTDQFGVYYVRGPW